MAATVDYLYGYAPPRASSALDVRQVAATSLNSESRSCAQQPWALKRWPSACSSGGAKPLGGRRPRPAAPAARVATSRRQPRDAAAGGRER